MDELLEKERKQKLNEWFQRIDQKCEGCGGSLYYFKLGEGYSCRSEKCREVGKIVKLESKK